MFTLNCDCTIFQRNILHFLLHYICICWLLCVYIYFFRLNYPYNSNQFQFELRQQWKNCTLRCGCRLFRPLVKSRKRLWTQYSQTVSSPPTLVFCSVTIFLSAVCCWAGSVQSTLKLWSKSIVWERWEGTKTENLCTTTKQWSKTQYKAL